MSRRVARVVKESRQLRGCCWNGVDVRGVEVLRDSRTLRSSGAVLAATELEGRFPYAPDISNTPTRKVDCAAIRVTLRTLYTLPRPSFKSGYRWDGCITSSSNAKVIRANETERTLVYKDGNEKRCGILLSSDFNAGAWFLNFTSSTP